MYKVLIVDDHPPIRLAVKVLLESEGYEIVAEARDGADAIQKTRELKPDVVILDIGLPKLDGLEVISRMRDEHEPVKIVMLTSQEPSAYSQRCMHAGAAGYVYKGEELIELLSAVRAVMKGYSYFPSISFSSVRASDTEASEVELLASLSDRELTVLRHLAEGLSNKEISEILVLSNKTISTHKYNIFEKLKIHTLLQLFELAKRHSLI